MKARELAEQEEKERNEEGIQHLRSVAVVRSTARLSDPTDTQPPTSGQLQMLSSLARLGHQRLHSRQIGAESTSRRPLITMKAGLRFILHYLAPIVSSDMSDVGPCAYACMCSNCKYTGSSRRLVSTANDVRVGDVLLGWRLQIRGLQSDSLSVNPSTCGSSLERQINAH